jgi:hypothetical protein
VGAIFYARAYARASSRALQHCGVFDRRRAAFLFFVECLLYETPAGRRTGRLPGILSRVDERPRVGIWATGTVFNLVAANYTGVAISYSIGQSAPMVAAVWGIFAWKEFDGANKRARAFLALMFIFYVLAILLIARANTAG